MRSSVGAVIRRGSLTVRLTVVATAATAVVLLLGLLGVFLVFTHQLDTAVDGSLRDRADDLQAAIAQSGPTAVRREGLAELYDRNGNVLASSGTVKSEAPLLASNAQIACPGGDLLFRSQTRLATGSTRPLRVLARCLPDNQVLAVAVTTEQQRAARNRLLQLLLVLAPVLLTGFALTLWRAVRSALHPVDELTRQAQQISDGDDAVLSLSATRRDDEITRLGTTLQEMLGRLSVAFSREQAFVDDAAHELRTPLAVLRGEIELALSDLSDGHGVEVSLTAALREAERLGRLAEDLLDLARQRASGPQTLQDIALLPLLTTFASRMESVFHVRLEVDCDDGLVLSTDPDRFDRILTNLVSNAADAQATTVLLTVRPGSLTVADDGPGFPVDFLPVAFERFSRPDAARTRTSGAGLGLALVQGLVTRLGGTVSVDNGSPLGGARVQLVLPVR